MLDPFTLVYLAVWDLLTANEDFCAMVPERNRIKYADDTEDMPASRHPERDSRQPTEWPQVAVQTLGPAAAMYCSSDATKVNLHLAILVKSGDKRLSYVRHGGGRNGVFPLQWTILRAMMPWEATLKNLSWNGIGGFVKHVAVIDGQNAQANPRMDEQLRPVRNEGWDVVWQGDAEMWFPSAALV